MSDVTKAAPAPAGGPPGDAAGQAPPRWDEVAPLMRLADLTTPMAVRVAATLRLADHMAAGRCHLEGLAEASGAHADTLRRLLSYLVARGVFTEPRPGTYGLTGVSRLLLDDHPLRMRARLAIDGATGRADLAMGRLLDTVLTGKPAYPLVYGRTFWRDLDSDGALGRSFADIMATNAANSGLAEAYDWTPVRRVVDVGGGTGTLVGELLRAHAHLEATLVDLPATVEAARAKLAEADLVDRVEIVGGTFFDPLPPGGDVYVLCKILHDWDDAEAVAILRRCAEAAGPRGRVLIIELTVTPEDDPVELTHMDMRMLTYMGGRERTLEEFRALAAAAGLRLERVGRGKWGSSLLEAVQASP